MLCSAMAAADVDAATAPADASAAARRPLVPASSAGPPGTDVLRLGLLLGRVLSWLGLGPSSMPGSTRLMALACTAPDALTRRGGVCWACAARARACRSRCCCARCCSRCARAAAATRPENGSTCACVRVRACEYACCAHPAQAPLAGACAQKEARSTRTGAAQALHTPPCTPPCTPRVCAAHTVHTHTVCIHTLCAYTH